MDELIRDALRFAKGAGEKSQEFELVTIVEDTLGIFEQDVELRVNVTRSYRVILAPNAFSRVLTNLVANGFKHGGQVIVTVTATELVVMDNGPGIPAEHRSQIFQPFFRLDRSRNATTGGSGLGLAIVDQLCQTHGWTITVGESPLGGAKFTLVFDSKERSD